MKVFEVNTPLLIKQFLELPGKLYKGNQNWTIQLGTDIEHTFDPDKNSFLKDGNAQRWILYDDWNIPVGRIAAFHSGTTNGKTGGIGFFECNHNKVNAQLLLNTAKDWLKEEGCTTAEGPINFGEKDRFWGLLASGYDSSTVYLDNYNPPYYHEFFEEASFSEKDNILTYSMPLSDLPVELTERAAQRLLNRDQITFRQFDYANLDEQVGDLHSIYVKCFDEQKRIRHLTKDDIYSLVNLNKGVLEAKAFWMAYKGEKPIGVSVYLTDLNQRLRATIYREETTRINLKSVVFAVIKEYRERGVELGLLYHMFNVLTEGESTYQVIFSGINANSRKIVSLMKKIGCTVDKIHKTFTVNL